MKSFNIFGLLVAGLAMGHISAAVDAGLLNFLQNMLQQTAEAYQDAREDSYFGLMHTPLNKWGTSFAYSLNRGYEGLKNVIKDNPAHAERLIADYERSIDEILAGKYLKLPSFGIRPNGSVMVNGVWGSPYRGFTVAPAFSSELFK